MGGEEYARLHATSVMGTNELTVQFVTRLMHAQPTVEECGGISRAVGGLGYIAPTDVRYKRGAPVGLYGGSTVAANRASEEFAVEHENGMLVLDGVPRARSPAVVLCNTPRGTSKTAQLEAAWFYLNTDGMSPDAVRDALDGFAVPLRGGGFAVYVYVARFAFTAAAGDELFVQTYGPSYFRRREKISALRRITNMPDRGRFFTAAMHVNVEGDTEEEDPYHFIGHFFGASVAGALRFVNDGTVAPHSRMYGAALGDAPVMGTQDRVLTQPSVYRRELFSFAFQLLVQQMGLTPSDSRGEGVVFTSSSYTRFLNKDGTDRMPLPREQLSHKIEAVSVARSMLDLAFETAIAVSEHPHMRPDLRPAQLLRAVASPGKRASAATTPSAKRVKAETVSKEEHDAAVGRLKAAVEQERAARASAVTALSGSLGEAQAELAVARERLHSSESARLAALLELSDQRAQCDALRRRPPTADAASQTEAGALTTRQRVLALRSQYRRAVLQRREGGDRWPVVVAASHYLSAGANSNPCAADCRTIIADVHPNIGLLRELSLSTDFVSWSAQAAVVAYLALALRAGADGRELWRVLGIAGESAVTPHAVMTMARRGDASEQFLLSFVHCCLSLLRRGLRVQTTNAVVEHRRASLNIGVVHSGARGIAAADQLVQDCARAEDHALFAAVMAWRSHLIQ